jgi:hypothetical protein
MPQSKQDNYLKALKHYWQLKVALVTPLQRTRSKVLPSTRSIVAACSDEFVRTLTHNRPVIPAKIEKHLDKHYHQCRRELMQKLKRHSVPLSIFTVAACKDGLLTGMVDGEDGRAFVTTTYIKNEFQPFRIEVRKM